MSPSNSILFSLPSFFLSYPIQLDDDAWLSILVSIVTVMDSRAHVENGAVELTGAFGVVLHIAAVLLHKVFVGLALCIFLGLDGVIVGCRGEDRAWVGVTYFVKAYDSTKTLLQANLPLTVKKVKKTIYSVLLNNPQQ